VYESGHRCSMRVNSAKAEWGGSVSDRSRRQTGAPKQHREWSAPSSHPGMVKIECCSPFAVKAEGDPLVPGAEFTRHGIQLAREQVTSACRTAPVLWVTPHHTRPRAGELWAGLPSARNRLQGPAGLGSRGGSRTLQAQGSLLGGKGTNRDFQQ